MPSDANAIRRWLHDMQHHLVLAQNFVAGMSCEALRDDLRTTYAVTRCLEIISEASRRLPDELKARHPSRELIRTGTAEGRARAKANGVKLGSKPKLMPHQ